MQRTLRAFIHSHLWLCRGNGSAAAAIVLVASATLAPTAAISQTVASGSLTPLTSVEQVIERGQIQTIKLAQWEAVEARFHGQRSDPAWSVLVAHASAISDISARINFVNDSINGYKFDSLGAGTPWKTPIEFLQSGGRCIEFSLAKYFALRESGVPAENLRIIVAYTLQDEGHAVLAVRSGGWRILDSLQKQIEPIAIVAYRAVYGFNELGWSIHPVESTPMTKSEPVILL
jgi:predicted transglutaminase-like cysteine proteinase